MHGPFGGSRGVQVISTNSFYTEWHVAFGKSSLFGGVSEQQFHYRGGALLPSKIAQAHLFDLPLLVSLKEQKGQFEFDPNFTCIYNITNIMRFLISKSDALTDLIYMLVANLIFIYPLTVISTSHFIHLA